MACWRKLTISRLQRLLLLFRTLNVLADACQLVAMAFVCDNIVAWAPSNRARAVAIACSIVAWVVFATVLAWHWRVYGRHLGHGLRTSDTMWTMRHYGSPIIGQWLKLSVITGLLVILLALPTFTMGTTTTTSPGWRTAWPAVPTLLLAHTCGGVFAVLMHCCHLLVLDVGGAQAAAAAAAAAGDTPLASRKRQAAQSRPRIIQIARINNDTDNMPSIYDVVQPVAAAAEDTVSSRTDDDDDDSMEKYQ